MKMPHIVSAYVRATNARDHDAFGALFTQDAIVHDEGQEHRGVAAIRRWLTSTVEKYQFTLTPTGLSQEGSETILFAYRPYLDMLAYGQSKTANVLFAVGATARWAKHGITANAAMPGSVHTNFVRNMDPDVVRALLDGKGLVGSDVPLRWKTPQQGAATSVRLATSPLLKGVGGRYFEDCNEAVRVSDNNGYVSGVAPYALNPANADRLWEESLRLLA